jgi:hypothetical protein
MIDLTDYQNQTTQTLKPSLLPIGSDSWTEYVGLQVVAETGEALGKFAKWIRDEDGSLNKLETMSDETAEAIAYELGDVLYFYAQIGLRFGWDLKVPPDYRFQRTEYALEVLSEASHVIFSATENGASVDDFSEGVSAIAGIADLLDYNIKEIAAMNIKKLRDRQARPWGAGGIGGYR